MNSLLHLRRESRRLVTGLQALPNQRTSFTSQARAKTSFGDVDRLESIPVAQLQDDSGNPFWMMDYDPL